MASSAAPPGVVDPTKPKSYPVILSDALLGKSSNEALTAIRYNHKPELSSDTGPNEAKLKPSPSDDDTFNLSFYENGGKWAYNGTRSAKENQYVLIFDPERKVFVLHRVDSMFHMNLARTPYNSDAQELKEKYPHIDSNIRPATDKKPSKAPAGKGPNKKTTTDSKKKEPPAAKAEPPEGETMASSQQFKADKDTKPKKQQRNQSPVGSDDEDDEDGDGGLLVEYPDPAPSAPARGQDFSPAFPTAIRRFSEFVRDEGPESDEDADAEYEEDILGEEDDDVSGEGGEGGTGFKLPSPVVGSAGAGAGGGSAQPSADDEGGDDFMEDDFEAELEKELEQQMSGMDVGDVGADAESDVSEED